MSRSIETVAVGDLVTFYEESEPYTVQARDDLFVILNRLVSVEEAEEDLELSTEYFWYTIVDLKRMIRGPHNRIFCFHEVGTREGCEQLLRDLRTGEIELSGRPSRHVEVCVVGIQKQGETDVKRSEEAGHDSAAADRRADASSNPASD